jgi:hypothetical protein
LLCCSGLAQDGKALFLEQCARCHGETGDGQGTETLDRPARSFQDGGFSFGDTELAIFRTITHGIPGSPMPAYGEGLTDAQRSAVVTYVRTLCPPRVEVTEEETYLIVDRHALVAKGLLPPVVDGARSHPRGLLLGTPDGLTFEYRADDLRLLAVRQGDFARRADWTGRGGAPLQPLGSVVWLNEDGDPPGMFFMGPDFTEAPKPLRLQLERSSTAHQDTSLTSLIVDSRDRVIGSVTEAPARLTTTLGSGFSRTLSVQLKPGAPPIAMRLPWSVPEKTFGGSLRTYIVDALRGSDIAGDGEYRSDLQSRVLFWSPGVRPLDGFGHLLLDPEALPKGARGEFWITEDVLLWTKMPSAAEARQLVRELLP